jgi:hypothetical protein
VHRFFYDQRDEINFKLNPEVVFSFSKGIKQRAGVLLKPFLKALKEKGS